MRGRQGSRFEESSGFKWSLWAGGGSTTGTWEIAERAFGGSGEVVTLSLVEEACQAHSFF